MPASIVFDADCILEKWNGLRIAGGYHNDSLFAEHLLEQEEKLQLFTPMAVLDTLAESDDDVGFEYKHRYDAVHFATVVTTEDIIPGNEIKKEFVSDDDLVQPIVKKRGRKPKLQMKTRDGNDVTRDGLNLVNGRQEAEGNSVSPNSGPGQARKWFHRCDLCLMFYKTDEKLRVHRENCNGQKRKKRKKMLKKKKMLKSTAVSDDDEESVEKKERKNKRKPNFCTICNKELGKCYKLSVHMRNVHCERTFTCEVCGKMFKTKDGLKGHERTHSEVERLQCDQCEKTFARASALKQHQKVHTGNLSICDICGQGFQCKAYLSQHRASKHAGEKRFKCKLCEKEFFTPSGLEYHMRRHRGEDGKKKLPCEYCGKPFYVGTRLREHINGHTGNRPYECTVCGKRFGKSKHLKQHSVVHTGLRPFKCKLCPKTFTASGSLYTHMKVHKAEASREGGAPAAAPPEDQLLKSSSGSGNITRAEAEVTRLRIEQMSLLYGLHGGNFG